MAEEFASPGSRIRGEGPRRIASQMRPALTRRGRAGEGSPRRPLPLFAPTPSRLSSREGEVRPGEPPNVRHRNSQRVCQPA